MGVSLPRVSLLFILAFEYIHMIKKGVEFLATQKWLGKVIFCIPLSTEITWFCMVQTLLVCGTTPIEGQVTDIGHRRYNAQVSY